MANGFLFTSGSLLLSTWPHLARSNSIEGMLGDLMKHIGGEGPDMEKVEEGHKEDAEDEVEEGEIVEEEGEALEEGEEVEDDVPKSVNGDGNYQKGGRVGEISKKVSCEKIQERLLAPGYESQDGESTGGHNRVYDRMENEEAQDQRS